MSDFQETCEQKYGGHLVWHVGDEIVSKCCERCGALYTPNQDMSKVRTFS